MAQHGGLSTARLARIADVVGGYVERGELAGAVALVARRDTVHVEAVGFQDLASGAPMRRDTIFRIASMTKPITAAAAMILMEAARIRLDDPAERWLPELANRRVLRSIGSPVDDTVPAARPITVRDLLTLRLGLGVVMARPGTYPIQAAMAESGLAPSADGLPFDPDEYMARIGSLPLMHQPGEQWLYHIGADILGVLIARAAGQPLETFLQEQIFGPLGMADTGFSVPETAIDRLATCYRLDEPNHLEVWDAARGGRYAQPPVFPNGLVSTADDYLAFGRMLLHQGRHPGGRILARPTVQLMMSDQLTPAQKAASPFFPGFWDNKGWGFGAAVTTVRDGIAATPGSYAWSGGCGTSFVVDPAEEMVAVLLTQRLMRGPDDAAVMQDFFTLAYQSIDD
jgi:CubicO group peptidase (beta-lactamase class C family)